MAQKNYSGLSSEDCAYIAGLFDGEGCVFADCKKKYGGHSYQLSFKLIITNTNLQVLKWCRNKIGVGHIVENATTSRISKGHKPCYRFIVEQAAMMPLARDMYHFLIVKKEQLSQALEFVNSRKTKPSRSSYSDFELNCFFNVKYIIQDSSSKIKIRNEYFTLAEFKKLVNDAATLNKSKVFSWDETSLKLLGTATDGAIAKTLGTNRLVVIKKRHALGIPPFKDF